VTISEKLKSGAVWNFVGFVFRFVIGLASSIIFVRLLGQQDYGVVTFTLSWVYFAGILCNLGLGNVLTQAIAEERASEVRETRIPSLVRKISLLRLMVIVGVAMIFIFADELAAAFGKAELAPFLYFVPPLVFTAIFQGMGKTILNSYYEQKLVNILSVWEMVLKLGLVVAAIQLGFGVIGFLSIIITVQIVTGGQMFIRARKQLAKKPKSKQLFRLRDKFSVAVDAFITAISIRVLGRQSDLLLLGMLHPDIREVAIYAVVIGLPAMSFDAFRTLIGGGLGLTAFTELVKTERWNELRESYTKILHIFSILILPMMVGGALVGGELAAFMYGEEYLGLDLPIAILFVCLGISIVSSVTMDLLYAFDLSRKLRNSRIAFGLANVVGNILIIPYYGATGVAIITGAVIVGMTINEFALVHNKLKPKYPKQIFARYLASAGLMGLVVIAIPFHFFGKIAVGAAVYGLLVFLGRRSDLVLQDMLRRRKP